MGANRVNWLTVPQQNRLNAACLDIARVFAGNCPYLVGSVLDPLRVKGQESVSSEGPER